MFEKDASEYKSEDIVLDGRREAYFGSTILENKRSPSHFGCYEHKKSFFDNILGKTKDHLKVR